MYVHIDYGCGFLPERREVVERAVHRPSATPDRTAGLSAIAMGKTWIETSPNATLRLFVAMSASSMCSERWAGRGADGATAATRRGFGFFAHELIKRATLSRGMSSRFLPYGPASSRSA